MSAQEEPIKKEEEALTKLAKDVAKIEEDTEKEESITQQMVALFKEMDAKRIAQHRNNYEEYAQELSNAVVTKYGDTQKNKAEKAKKEMKALAETLDVPERILAFAIKGIYSLLIRRALILQDAINKLPDRSFFSEEVEQFLKFPYNAEMFAKLIMDIKRVFMEMESAKHQECRLSQVWWQSADGKKALQSCFFLEWDMYLKRAEKIYTKISQWIEYLGQAKDDFSPMVELVKYARIPLIWQGQVVKALHDVAVAQTAFHKCLQNAMKRADADPRLGKLAQVMRLEHGQVDWLFILEGIWEKHQQQQPSFKDAKGCIDTFVQEVSMFCQTISNMCADIDERHEVDWALMTDFTGCDFTVDF